MRLSTFSEEILAEIRQDRSHHPHPRAQPKVEVLWLKSRGLTHPALAERADVSPRPVQRYLDEFEEGGLERVRRLGRQGKHCAPGEPQASLEDYFIGNPPRSAGEAQQAVERLTGIRRGPSQARAFLKGKLAWAGAR